MKSAWSQFWLPCKGRRAQGCPSRTAGLQAQPEPVWPSRLAVDAYLPHVQQIRNETVRGSLHLFSGLVIE